MAEVERLNAEALAAYEARRADLQARAASARTHEAELRRQIEEVQARHDALFQRRHELVVALKEVHVS